MKSGKKRGAPLSERLLRTLFPARCLLCGRVTGRETFCPSCARDVPKLPCERRLAAEGAGSAGLRVISPLSYSEGFRQTLYRYKFRGERSLAGPIGRLMASAVPEDERPDAVTWVPLAAEGKKRRGYDQSELLAKAMARSLGVPCIRALEKTRKNLTQHELSRRQRAANVKNVYRALPGAEEKALLLVDDIVTTGATLTECASVLYRAGAKSVLCVCAADAPPGLP